MVLCQTGRPDVRVTSPGQHSSPHHQPLENQITMMIHSDMNTSYFKMLKTDVSVSVHTIKLLNVNQNVVFNAKKN